MTLTAYISFAITAIVLIGIGLYYNFRPNYKASDCISHLPPPPRKGEGTRYHNVGNSDYALHKIQPWDVWIEYQLNPFDGDILKRLLRTKKEPGMTETEARLLDYKKMIHVCQERIRQLETGKDPFK